MNFNWIEFSKLLCGEFIKNNTNITEGMIRYWFVECIRGVVEDLSIEESYFGKKIKRNSSKQQLIMTKKNVPHADLYFENNNKSYVFEFKYDVGTNYTEIVGKVLHDFNRLSVIDNDEKYLIYVFSKNVKNYYQNKFNGIFDIDSTQATYTIDGNFSWENKKSFPKSFIKEAFKSFTNKHTNFSQYNYTINRIIGKQIPNSTYYIFVYKVL